MGDNKVPSERAINHSLSLNYQTGRPPQSYQRQEKQLRTRDTDCGMKLKVEIMSRGTIRGRSGNFAV